MNKRQKKKVQKGKFYFCKCRMLWKHHKYQPNINSKEIMLLYDVTGNEILFTSWKVAKHYMRRLPIENYGVDFPSSADDNVPF